MIIPVPETPSAPPTPRSSGLFSLKRMPFIIGIIVVVIVIVGGSYLLSKSGLTKQNKSTQSTNSSSQSKQSSSSSGVVKPFTKIFRGTINKVENNSLSVKIATEENPVKISYEKSSILRTSAPLVEGKNVVVEARYDIKNKIWIAQKIAASK